MIPTVLSALVSLLVLVIFVAGILALGYVGVRMLQRAWGDADAP